MDTPRNNADLAADLRDDGQHEAADRIDALAADVAAAWNQDQTTPAQVTPVYRYLDEQVVVVGTGMLAGAQALEQHAEPVVAPLSEADAIAALDHAFNFNNDDGHGFLIRSSAYALAAEQLANALEEA